MQQQVRAIGCPIVRAERRDQKHTPGGLNTMSLEETVRLRSQETSRSSQQNQLRTAESEPRETMYTNGHISIGRNDALLKERQQCRDVVRDRINSSRRHDSRQYELNAVSIRS